MFNGRIFSGTSSFRSFDTHDEVVDGNKSERIVFRLEYGSFLSSCSRRHGKMLGAPQ